MTLSDQMVEAAALSRYERMRKIYVRWPAWADADQRTKERWCENARLDLTAALALAEAEGAVFMRWPPDGDDVQACADEVNPYAETAEQYGLTVEMVCDIIEAWKRRAATLAGRVWP